jgi:regulatory protein
MKNNPSEIGILERLRYLCSKSEKCVKDIHDKLKSWNYEGNYDKIAEKLITEGFINEERYAFSVANDKVKFSKWGKAKVKYFLKGKGIGEEIINRAIENLSDDDYENLVLKELTKKLKSIKETDKYKRKQKLISFAFQRGYDNDLIYKLAERLIS